MFVNVCTQYVCTQYVCTQYVCTQYVCTQYVCTQYVCTQYVCTQYPPPVLEIVRVRIKEWGYCTSYQKGSHKT